jgi:DNA polymerase III delta subunit
MIYLLHGTDIIKSREKLHSLLGSMFAKKPDASFVRVEAGEFDESRLDEFVGGQGLFTNKYIIVFDNLFLDKKVKEVLLKSLKEISKSENIFIFLEEKLNKTELNKFEKYAEKIQEFVGVEIEKKKKFDIFSLTEALGKRDKKNLWVLYQKAKMNNVSDEEVHGILFWQVKSMLLSLNTKDAKESGLNPFVFRKSLGFVKNYSESELRKLSFSLISLYHDTRRGVHEMDSAMERFILGI